MVWVGHETQIAADLADRTLVLDHGAPLAEERPQAVLKDPRLIEAYLGSRAAA